MAETSGLIETGRDPTADPRTRRIQERTGGSPLSLLADESIGKDKNGRLVVPPNIANGILAYEVFGP